MTPNTPQTVDQELAEVHADLYRAHDQLERIHDDLKSIAGAEFYYRGKRRVTDMTIGEALEIVRRELGRLEAHEKEHAGEEARWTTFEGPILPHNRSRAERSVQRNDEVESQIRDLALRARELESLYTGWSRFFLVTSSAGHIHSSTHCSSCNARTRFGWLPQLSGQSEETAVEELGPTLCTVCFPSAPVDWTSGKKLTAAQAIKKAA